MNKVIDYIVIFMLLVLLAISILIVLKQHSIIVQQTETIIQHTKAFVFVSMALISHHRR